MIGPAQSDGGHPSHPSMWLISQSHATETQAAHQRSADMLNHIISSCISFAGCASVLMPRETEKEETQQGRKGKAWRSMQQWNDSAGDIRAGWNLNIPSWRLPALKIKRKIHIDMKDDISIYQAGMSATWTNTRPDTGAIQGWHKNEILSP